MNADEEILRRLIWLTHGHDANLYGDDGEMQCSRCPLDFKRASVREIEACLENNALYDIAKRVCLEQGMPYTDPRTGVTTQPKEKRP